MRLPALLIAAVLSGAVALAGTIVWSHDGWLSPAALEAAVATHS